jgi:hypothetical protein
MTSRNEESRTLSVTGRLLNLPATIINRLAWRVFRVNRCRIDGQSIVLHKGLFTSRIVHASEIERWSFCPEMGFDIVRIRLTSGELLTWIDKYNDLLGSLRMLVESKETPADEPSVSN